MKHRNIGVLITNAMNYAEHHRESEAIIMLDQEKAYDRIHHQYLRQIMQMIQLPNKWIVSIMNLFNFTKVHLSITGHISAPLC